LILASAIGAVFFGAIGRAFGVVPTLPFLGFVAGYVSHLILDSLTTEGVPWLFPVPVYLGFPPWPGLRVRTSSLAEQFIAMPALLTSIGWIGYAAGPALLAWWR